MNTLPAQHAAIGAYRWTVTGRVQGVGFRPFVYRLATRLGLAGTVSNRGGCVVIEAQGPAKQLAQFETALLREAPAIARPQIHDCAPIPLRESLCESFREQHGFVIDISSDEESSAPHVTPDYPVCAQCLAEMHDPGNRRYRHPFITCTQCGPRYTLIERLPYDRPNTGMADFTLCPQCVAEYADPKDRRFHAQPIACPHCGPQLQFVGHEQSITGNEPALAAAVDALIQGNIVAVKGVGGYHLMVDAANAAAVERLRRRKHRPHKPFAVMFPWRGADGCDAVREAAELSGVEQDRLTSTERPVVLLTLRDHHVLADNLAPGLDLLGALLPYSPLHHLLLDALDRPLVATSANLSGEPVIIDNAVAEQRLADVADAFLHHDRPILRPADDGVVRHIARRARPLRLGRGSAPLEMTLPFHLTHPVLALGGQQKNTLCLAWKNRIVISPHLGDLHQHRAQKNFEHHARALASLYGVEPSLLIADAHPDYHTTRWAKAINNPTPRRMPGSSGLNSLDSGIHRDDEQAIDVHFVHHHHAHASALCGEHSRFEHDTLVFTWDGTGLGPDGSLWGGEALFGRPGQWRRVASFRPFPLLGGDRAIREPWRMAAALCWETRNDWQPLSVPKEIYSLLHQAWQRKLNSPPCTAIGRLFDAAAALLGLVDVATYDAQAPMLLENIAEGEGRAVPLPHAVDEAGVLRCDWQPLLRHLIDERLSVEQRAADFHRTLAQTLLVQAEYARGKTGIRTVGLSGGVFQNRRLTETVVDELAQAGFEVLLHERIPCNDAGLSYGQLMHCLAELRLSDTTYA